MDETETVVLNVCVTMSQEDMILSQVSQEDMTLSHVYIYVCVVSLITNFSVSLSLFAYLSLYASVDLSQFPKKTTIAII